MEMGRDVGESGHRKVVQVDELTSNETLSINKVYLTYTSRLDTALKRSP